MNRYLDPYIGMFRITLKDYLYYKTDFILGMLFSVGYAVLMIFVWSVLFASSGKSQIGGFTLEGIYAYFFLFTAYFGMSQSNISNTMQNNILQGTITLSMTRPVNYVTQLLLGSLGRWVVATALLSLPMILIAVIIAHVPISLYGVALSMASIALGFAVYGLISFLIGTVAIFITYIYGIRYVSSMLIYLAAGGVLPLSMFPQYIANFMYSLPFQTMGYLPVSILLGTATPSAIINGFTIGIIWAIALAIFAFFWWKKVKGRVSSVGG